MRLLAQSLDYGCVMRDADSGPSFAELITNGRLAKTWSQTDLQDQSGVSRSSISRYERGLTDTPEPEHVRALCAALNIDPRQAAVSLGYLTTDEIQPLKPLPPKMKEVLDILEDPNITAEDKERWIDYLMYLKDRARSRTDS